MIKYEFKIWNIWVYGFEWSSKHLSFGWLKRSELGQLWRNFEESWAYNQMKMILTKRQVLEPNCWKTQKSHATYHVVRARFWPLSNAAHMDLSKGTFIFWYKAAIWGWSMALFWHFWPDLWRVFPLDFEAILKARRT